MGIGEDMVRDVISRDLGHPLRVAIDGVTASGKSTVVDGTFLHRPPLPDYWDYTVFVDTPMDVARARGTVRDADALGGEVAAGIAFDQRYHAACRVYLDEVDPRARATRVLPGIDSLLSMG
ncbi:hypothetical protein [Rhodococcus sp. IEGM1428]|uniref:hypothetical protein n=1 Tax=Rhodococcus sp. IEGM1428 TaxID=3392191 RepID=UPI003D125FCD